MIFDEHGVFPEEIEVLWREMNAMKGKATIPLEIPPPSFRDMDAEFCRYR